MTTSLHTDVSGWATRLNAEDVARYTSSGVWRNVTLAENARRQAEQDAQRIAVIEGNRSVNFGTLLAQANQLAAAFQTLGLRAGDVISFQLPNWIETMVINTAACIADLVVNPIVPIYREAEVRYILRDARPKLVLHSRTVSQLRLPRDVSAPARRGAWSAGLGGSQRSCARMHRLCVCHTPVRSNCRCCRACRVPGKSRARAAEISRARGGRG